MKSVHVLQAQFLSQLMLVCVQYGMEVSLLLIIEWLHRTFADVSCSTICTVCTICINSLDICILFVLYSSFSIVTGLWAG